MNDSELLDCLDQIDNLEIYKAVNECWYIRSGRKTYAEGYLYIRDAIHVAAIRIEHEQTSSTL